ncbi:cystathionine beta-lyase family protein involved in aluminum resistance [Scopulibacillus darangshiensis]|uniref:Cystathionine beta-lyase family protein involved in aluminum resistance n=1 Tax=Scopulibacillus darangshiensis TaxID=442528 RepID=A0A4R2P7K0_9BACL|nr:methionine gamma-lyase family protein [Scopulibacillus darangshiensis]TCP30248.1 cystathionine beta-lyase family protein involved in aluminum resistance [Scopulibacillus darangshiensis]
MYNQLKHGGRLKTVVTQVKEQIKQRFEHIEKIAEANQYSVLKSFQEHRISDTHFHGTTGYGYDDFGREGIEAVYADVFGGEAGLVRPQLISGTHAISTALFGVLRPGDELLYITGRPYDTLGGVIGLSGESISSLKSFGIGCSIIPLKDGQIDVEQVLASVGSHTRLIAIQRSCGYDTRPSFSVNDIEKTIKRIKTQYPEVTIFVDNCYGEFVEEREPCHAGADLMAGSLIKNPGGGLVKSGGYIVGKEDLVDRCAERLTAPGLGREVGPTAGSLTDMYQGFFLAPHTTAQALKGAVFTAALMDKLGMKTTPNWDAHRTDLIQSVTFNDPDKMVTFCQAIQKASPINSHVTPYPSPMPGYESDVIMAAGTFVQGGSLELSADGPLRPPYTAFVQGGLTFEHVKAAILIAVDELMDKEWH